MNRSFTLVPFIICSNPEDNFYEVVFRMYSIKLQSPSYKNVYSHRYDPQILNAVKYLGSRGELIVLYMPERMLPYLRISSREEATIDYAAAYKDLLFQVMNLQTISKYHEAEFSNLKWLEETYPKPITTKR